MEIIAKMLAGDELSLSRIISMLENDEIAVPTLMKFISPHIGKAHCVGITGPPGVGKSSLIDKLISFLRQHELTVGVVAVDPSSPFSGGAVLGDRIRMHKHALDRGVFIRSMASRDSTGGLPHTASAVIKALDAYGKDHILIETVGVGQTEIDIVKSADTVLVTLAPEAGDDVQMMKAGLLEIADIFVVNKSDHPGADDLVLSIENMLHLRERSQWVTPIVRSEAPNNIGIDEIYRSIQRHRQYLGETGLLYERRKSNLRDEFIERIKEKFLSRLLDVAEQDSRLSGYVSRVENGEIDTHTAADEFLKLSVAQMAEDGFQN